LFSSLTFQDETFQFSKTLAQTSLMESHLHLAVLSKSDLKTTKAKVNSAASIQASRM